MNDILERIKLGRLPDQAQRAVVQGLMPLAPEVLITSIFFLCSKSTNLLADARSTISGLPDGVKRQYFEDRELEPDILSFYLREFSLPREARMSLLLNPNTPAGAIKSVCPGLQQDLLDLVVNNQVKILADPDIIKELRKNSGLSINQKRKLDEYENLLLKELVSPAEELENKSIKDIESEAMDVAMQFVKTFGKDADASRESVARDQSQVKSSVLEQIATMTIPQKVQAAIKGSREIRHILIKDANKLVCTAVVRSPRVTDGEVEFYSNLRNVQSEVLRIIASNREWLKNYKIIHNLVKNPRTPIACSMKLLPRIHKYDLKNLERDRGIPEAVRSTAKRIMRTKV